MEESTDTSVDTETKLNNENQTTINKTKESELPERFQKPDVWNYKKKEVNPMYQTSSQTLGIRPPTKQEMPAQYHPQVSAFSRTFTGGMYKDSSLNTSKDVKVVKP